MATARQIVNKALLLLGVKTAGVDLTDEEIESGIETMNDMVVEMDARGLRLGYSLITDPDQVITSPDWVHSALKYNLAVRLAPEYDVNPAQAVVAVADQTYNHIVIRSVRVDPVKFPDILPVGTGNKSGADGNSPRFFTNQLYNDLNYANGGRMVDQRGRVINAGFDTAEEGD